LHENKCGEINTKVIEACSRAKAIIAKSNMKPVDEYVYKNLTLCEDEASKLGIYM
jgi:hypothetical protein